MAQHCIAQTETALLFDAVSLFARSLDDLDRTQTVNRPNELTCDSRIAWQFGLPLMNIAKIVSVAQHTLHMLHVA